MIHKKILHNFLIINWFLESMSIIKIKNIFDIFSEIKPSYIFNLQALCLRLFIYTDVSLLNKTQRVWCPKISLCLQSWFEFLVRNRNTNLGHEDYSEHDAV